MPYFIMGRRYWVKSMPCWDHILQLDYCLWNIEEDEGCRAAGIYFPAVATNWVDKHLSICGHQSCNRSCLLLTSSMASWLAINWCANNRAWARAQLCYSQLHKELCYKVMVKKHFANDVESTGRVTMKSGSIQRLRGYIVTVSGSKDSEC